MIILWEKIRQVVRDIWNNAKLTRRGSRSVLQNVQLFPPSRHMPSRTTGALLPISKGLRDLFDLPQYRSSQAHRYVATVYSIVIPTFTVKIKCSRLCGLGRNRQLPMGCAASSAAAPSWSTQR